MKKKYISPRADEILVETEHVLAASVNTNIGFGNDDAYVGGEDDDALTNKKDMNNNYWEE